LEDSNSLILWYNLNMKDIDTYITSDVHIAHGKPVFKGTRIMVYLVLEMLASEEDADKIIEAYPTLTKKHIAAALAFASQTTEMRGSFVSFNHAVSH
jgi:uncharacterized protein (DUF433 family)